MKSKRKFGFWKAILLSVLLLPVLIFLGSVTVLYFNQDKIIANFIEKANEKIGGKISIEDQHISPFENFPYISIDLNHVRLFEKKEDLKKPILHLEHAYVGFDLWTVLGGKMEIKSIELKGGSIDLVQDSLGVLNLTRAVATKDTTPSESSELKINLKKIIVLDVDINKFNQKNKIKLDVFIDKLNARFKASPEHLAIGCETKFVMNILKGKDTTFFKHKHLDLSAKLDYDKIKQILNIEPSVVSMEQSDFNMAGSINIKKDMDLSLRFGGKKPNFDLLFAFAPEGSADIFKQYKNKGNVYFTAFVNGKSINGYQPLVKVFFGCRNAEFVNIENGKKLDLLNFTAFFTNGSSRHASTMEFAISSLSARLENGSLKGKISVKNFLSPEIDLETNTAFQLQYIASFLNLKKLKGISGGVNARIHFNDIIDPKNPSKALQNIGNNYALDLGVSNLNFNGKLLTLPIKNLNLSLKCKGKTAEIEKCSGQLGNSDVTVKAFIDDFPSIIHHSQQKVNVDMVINSKLIDLAQLTLDSTGKKAALDEKINDLSLSMSFKGSARDFTESKTIPVGEFDIKSFSARFKNYPHHLHDLKLHANIERENIKILNFNGVIDKSDFELFCLVSNYPLLFENQPNGELNAYFKLKSNLLQFHDIFTYNSVNYMPEDYRHEECRQLHASGKAEVGYNQGKISSAALSLNSFDVGMKIHPLRLAIKNLKAIYSDEHLHIDNIDLTAGNSHVNAKLSYYLGKDSTLSKKDNHLTLIASNLDMDQLFNYEQSENKDAKTPAEHEKAFNIYDLPFPNMTFDIQLSKLKYHRYHLTNFNGSFITKTNHHILIKNLTMNAAGGNISFTGEFDGSNRNKIFIDPKMKISNVSIDQLLFKFENFGQDYLVSENVHGRISGDITGHIRVHPDLIPVLDESVVNLDLKMTEGRLENYGPMSVLSSYFKDKNLNKVLFDTLENHFRLNKGVLDIPSMTINSSLGFIDISGKQSMDLDMEYYVKVPIKMVTRAGWQKLFGKSNDNAGKEDEIQYKSESKNLKFLNLKIKGKGADFKISLGKDKSG